MTHYITVEPDCSNVLDLRNISSLIPDYGCISYKPFNAFMFNSSIGLLNKISIEQRIIN